MNNRFGEGDFFDGGEEYNNDYYDEDEEEYMAHQGAMIGAAIPIELMDRWKQSEVNLEVQKINYTVLKQAVKMLEKSWFWRFRSLKSRVHLISDTYSAMMDLVNPGQ